MTCEWNTDSRKPTSDKNGTKSIIKIFFFVRFRSRVAIYKVSVCAFNEGGETDQGEFVPKCRGTGERLNGRYRDRDVGEVGRGNTSSVCRSGRHSALVFSLP